jgi:hypothetical protein
MCASAQFVAEEGEIMTKVKIFKTVQFLPNQCSFVSTPIGAMLILGIAVDPRMNNGLHQFLQVSKG